MSAVFASLSVFLVFKILISEGVDLPSSVLACLSLCVSHLFWMYAVINETYSLASFFLLLCLFFCLKWLRGKENKYIYLASVIFGMGYANHALMVLFLPGILILIAGRRLLKLLLSYRILLVIACFLLGAFPVFLLPLFQRATIREVLSQLIGSLREHREVYNKGLAKLLHELMKYPLYLFYQFPNLGAAFAIYGVVQGLKRNSRFVLCTLAIWLATLLFAIQYFFQRQFPLMIPSFVVVSIWLGMGVSYFSQRYERWRIRRAFILAFVILVVLPPVIYFSVYRVAESMSVNLSFIRQLPYRNNYRYFLFPPKNMERGAEKYARDCFLQAKPGAIILTDFNPGMALLYSQTVLKQRQDIQLEAEKIDDWIHHSREPAKEIREYLESNVGEGKPSVYLGDSYDPYYFISTLQDEFVFAKTNGPLLEVKRKSAAIPTGQ